MREVWGKVNNWCFVRIITRRGNKTNFRSFLAHFGNEFRTKKTGKNEMNVFVWHVLPLSLSSSSLLLFILFYPFFAKPLFSPLEVVTFLLCSPFPFLPLLYPRQECFFPSHITLKGRLNCLPDVWCSLMYPSPGSHVLLPPLILPLMSITIFLSLSLPLSLLLVIFDHRLLLSKWDPFPFFCCLQLTWLTSFWSRLLHFLPFIKSHVSK